MRRRSTMLTIQAVLWGASFEALAVGHEPGLGWLLLTLAVWVSCQLLSHRLERPAPPWVQLLWLVPFSFAGSLTLYDAEAVRVFAPGLTCLGLITCAGLTLAPERDLLHLAEAPGRGVLLLGGAPLHAPGAVRELAEWGSPRWAIFGRILRGALAAVPLLIVFTALFAAADEMFCRTLTEGTYAFTGDLLWPLARVLVLTLAALGFLHGAIAQTAPEPRPAGGSTWDPLSLSVTVFLLNLLFLSFLMVQARYLCGADTTLPIWEYARRGFFELATCTALVFLLVLGVYATSAPQGFPRLLASLLILQTAGVAASAFYRMGLYSEAYGLSVLRIYATLGILAMVSGLGILLAAIGRDWRSRETGGLWLASRLALGGMVFLAAVAWLDVEGGISRYNLGRWAAGREVDLAYLGTLSADAAPALAADSHGDPGVHLALQAIRARRQGVDGTWQGWNASRAGLSASK